MIEEVKKDILSILAEALEAFAREDYVGFKEISNHTIHDASIYQDEDSLSIAVIIFSLYKIAGRSQGREKEACGKIIGALSDAYELLKKGAEEDYRKALKRAFESISRTDKKFGLYVEEVINQAQIKKGSKLYEHGISASRAASLLGISQWELMGYVGKTIMPGAETETFDVRDRVNFAKKLFGV